MTIRNTFLRLGACSVLLILGSGCATVPPLAPPALMPTREHSFKAPAGGNILVAADPYYEQDKGRTMFRQDVRTVGLLPVWVVVENNAPSAVVLRRDRIALVTPDKTILAMSPASALMKLQPVTQEAQGAATVYGGLSGWFLTKGAPGVSSRELSKFVEDTALTERTVVPGEKDGFFVYFDRPKSFQSTEGVTLSVTLTDSAGNKLREAQIQLGS